MCRRKKEKSKEREVTNLRVITIKGGSVICKMESGRDVKVNLQNVPFEICIGDNLEGIIYYAENNEIESVIVIDRN